MEHTKKMVLVEPRQIEKWKETMLDKTLSKLDTQMYEILHRDIADDDKAKLYSNSLSRYLNIDKPTVLTKFEKKEDELTTTDKTQPTKPNSIEAQVLETVPKKWKTQAARLLSHMKSNPDVSWNAKGELVLKNAAVPKTHVVDLVNDLLRKRTTASPPTGWMQLADAVKDSNIPRELIGNQDRWKYISGPFDESQSFTSKSRHGKHQQLESSWLPY
jgi:hypothetical protein